MSGAVVCERPRSPRDSLLIARPSTLRAAAYLADGLGSTMAIVDSSGNSQKSYTYDVYGEATPSGSLANEFDFAGQQTDGTGLQYLRARYYDPETGTFLSREPMAVNSGWLANGFQFAANSPTRFSDPSGLFIIEGEGGASDGKNAGVGASCGPSGCVPSGAPPPPSGTPTPGPGPNSGNPQACTVTPPFNCAAGGDGSGIDPFAIARALRTAGAGLAEYITRHSERYCDPYNGQGNPCITAEDAQRIGSAVAGCAQSADCTYAVATGIGIVGLTVGVVTASGGGVVVVTVGVWIVGQGWMTWTWQEQR